MRAVSSLKAGEPTDEWRLLSEPRESRCPTVGKDAGKKRDPGRRGGRARGLIALAQSV